MKRVYIKPIMSNINQTKAIVPIVAAVAAALGVSQAVAGLGLGAAAGAAAGYGAVSASKKSGFDFTQENFIPSLEPVEVFR